MAILLIAALFLVAIGAAWRGARLLVRGIREADRPAGPMNVVRGFRGLTVALGLGAAGAGLLSAHTWLVVFGVIFLAEEVYETGLLLLILKSGLRTPPAQGRVRIV